LVDIAPSACHFRQRLGTEPLIKDAIPERLCSVDIRACFRQPHLQCAGPDIDDCLMESRRGRQCCLNRCDGLLLDDVAGDHPVLSS
jgi:hypothetical protein